MQNISKISAQKIICKRSAYSLCNHVYVRKNSQRAIPAFVGGFVRLVLLLLLLFYKGYLLHT